jgi:hypothetical protein
MGMLDGFMSGFQKGASFQDDRQYKKLRNRVLQQKLDPEMDKLNKEFMKARIGHLNRAGADRNAPLRALQIQELQLRLKDHQDEIAGTGRWVAPAGADSSAAPITAPIAPAPVITPKPQSAIPTGTNVAANDTEDDEDTQTAGEAVPTGDTQNAASGGRIRSVKKYAEGGDVSNEGLADVDDDGIMDDDQESPQQVAQRGALPENYDRISGPEDYEAQGGSSTRGSGEGESQEGGTLGFSMEAAHDAAREGLTRSMRLHQARTPRGALPTPDRPGGDPKANPHAAHNAGAGAASPDEVTKVMNKIDPDHKMSDTNRHMAALAHVYTFYQGKNDDVGAKNAAMSLVQRYKMDTMKYAGIAKNMLDNGDMDGATDMAAKAYAGVPDGMQVKFYKNQDGTWGYSHIDEQGNTVKQGVFSPAQLGDQLLKLQTGGFEQHILNAAGMREQAKGGAAPKMADFDKGSELVKNAYGDPGKDEDPAAHTASKSIATRVFMDSTNRKNNVTADEASSVTKGMLNEPKFQADNAEGGKMVKIGTNAPVFVPKAQFDQVIDILAQKRNALKKATAKSGTGLELPGNWMGGNTAPDKGQLAKDVAAQRQDIGGKNDTDDSLFGVLGRARKALQEKVKGAPRQPIINNGP